MAPPNPPLEEASMKSGLFVINFVLSTFHSSFFRWVVSVVPPFARARRGPHHRTHHQWTLLACRTHPNFPPKLPDFGEVRQACDSKKFKFLGRVSVTGGEVSGESRKTPDTTSSHPPYPQKMKQNVTQKREKFNHNFSSTFLCYSFCLFIFLVGSWWVRLVGSSSVVGWENRLYEKQTQPIDRRTPHPTNHGKWTQH